MMNDYHDPKNDCSKNKNHRGLRSRLIIGSKYMLVCAECGNEIRETYEFRGSNNMTMGDKR